MVVVIKIVSHPHPPLHETLRQLTPQNHTELIINGNVSPSGLIYVINLPVSVDTVVSERACVTHIPTRYM